jgi:hypothetical protein
MRPRDHSADHIGAVSVCVHDAGLKPCDERAQRAIFPQIASCPDHYAGNGHPKRFQLTNEGVTICGAWLHYRRDVDRIRFLSQRHHRNYSLKPTFPHWSENVEDSRVVPRP